MAGGETRTQAVGVATVGRSQVACPQVNSTTASPATLQKRLLVLLGRIVLAATTLILSVNLCTGLPVLALWVGSQTTGDQPFSMTGIVATVVVLAILEAGSVIALTRISTTYDRMIGRPPPVRQPPPWALAMSAARAQPAGRRQVNAIEAIVIAVVVAAFIAFEFWFFFLASPVV